MPSVEHIEAIGRFTPRTLIDVGANKGQFSLMARYLLPNIQIHAFEPLEAERKLYQSVVKKPTKLYATALGSMSGQATFFVTSRPDSSSLLQPATAQKSAYGVEVTSSITVSVVQLSHIIDITAMARPILLKLDVQGGELDVLKGAEDILPLIDTIYCEVSLVRLYERQPLAGEIVNYLAGHGFALRGVFNQSVTKAFGPTQADFLFERDHRPTFRASPG
jgi:FkbM family methyltransferase